jgi:hypothetical protein
VTADAIARPLSSTSIAIVIVVSLEFVKRRWLIEQGMRQVGQRLRAKFVVLLAEFGDVLRGDLIGSHAFRVASVYVSRALPHKYGNVIEAPDLCSSPHIAVLRIDRQAGEVDRPAHCAPRIRAESDARPSAQPLTSRSGWRTRGMLLILRRQLPTIAAARYLALQHVAYSEPQCAVVRDQALRDVGQRALVRAFVAALFKLFDPLAQRCRCFVDLLLHKLSDQSKRGRFVALPLRWRSPRKRLRQFFGRDRAVHCFTHGEPAVYEFVVCTIATASRCVFLIFRCTFERIDFIDQHATDGVNHCLIA